MLISDDYRQLNTELHERREDYGTSSYKWIDTVREMCAAFNTTDVLDYGAGKCKLSLGLPFKIQNYDPAIKKLSDRPVPADVVVCTDVMEHIEPECLDAVLDDIKSLTRKVVFFTVATRPAVKELADGRNAHLIVEKYEWWLPKLMQRFDMMHFNRQGDDEFIFVGTV